LQPQAYAAKTTTTTSRGRTGDTCLLPTVKGAAQEAACHGLVTKQPPRLTSGQPLFVTASDIEMRIESR